MVDLKRIHAKKVIRNPAKVKEQIIPLFKKLIHIGYAAKGNFSGNHIFIFIR